MRLKSGHYNSLPVNLFYRLIKSGDAICWYEGKAKMEGGVSQGPFCVALRPVSPSGFFPLLTSLECKWTRLP